MKRAISIVLVVGLVCLLCSFSVAAASNETAITVFQENSNYNQWSLQSPVYYGGLNSSNYTYPINLCISSNAVGTFTSATGPTSVVIDVSDPLIAKKGTTVYVGFYEAYSTFKGSYSMPTYFVWDPNVPGYMMRAAASSSYGPNRTDYLSVTGPSNFSPVIKRTQSGSSTGASFPSSSYSVLGSYTPYTHEPQTGGAWYVQPNWVTASNSYKVMKISIGSNNDNYTNVRIELDSNDVSKFTHNHTIADTYPLLGVFVPLCLVVDTNDYNQAQLDKLDDIIDALVDLNTSVTDGFTNIVNILNQNFADILASIGTSTGSHDNILDYLQSIIQSINGIQIAIQHQSGDPTQFSSSVQYIEYYLSRVLENTDVFVEYIQNISDTMEDMEEQIDDTNDAIDGLDDDVTDSHEQEQQMYEDCNDAIGNLAISDFQFDGFTGQGVRGAGTLFERLWTATGPVAQVYNFALILTVTMTILRYTTRRPKERQSSKSGGKKGG